MTYIEHPLRPIRRALDLDQIESVLGIPYKHFMRYLDGASRTLPVGIIKPEARKALYVDYGVELPGDSDLSKQYQEWALWDVSTNLIVPRQSLKAETTLQEWVNYRFDLGKLNAHGDTVYGAARVMHVNPYVIEKFENGKTKRMPKQLIEADTLAKENNR